MSDWPRQSGWKSEGNHLMQIGRIEGATRTLGKSQGYMGLPVRDDLINERVTGEGTPCMTTAWLPTPVELAALNMGAAVHVRIIGTAHPPIIVETGPCPIEDVATPKDTTS